MDLTPYVTALRDDLAAAASVGDEQTARAGNALAGALEPAVRLALMNALSDLASEISGSLDDHTVSLRLRGREVDVVVDRTAGPTPPADEETAGGFFAGPSSSPFVGPGGPFRRPGFDQPGFAPPGRPGAEDISRMTLRLVDQIKGQAEQAAASQGMSLNSWISQAVQGALAEKWAAKAQRRGRWQGGESGFRGDDRWDDDGGGDGGRRGPGGSDRPRSSSDPTDPTGPTASSGTGKDTAPGATDEGPDDGRDGGVTGWVRG